MGSACFPRFPYNGVRKSAMLHVSEGRGILIQNPKNPDQEAAPMMLRG